MYIISLPMREILDPLFPYRFWSYVDRYTKNKSNNDCWIWIGNTNKGGRPRIRINDIAYNAARVAYALQTGKDPGKNYILHNCYPNADNPKCINIEHLRLGTHSENMLDRSLRGKRSSSLKLNPESIIDIRKLHAEGYTIQAISEMYNISRSNIQSIVDRKTWNHIE